MSDIIFSGAARRMVSFALWENIGLENFQMRVHLQSVGCGEGIAADGCTLGNIVVSCG